MPGVSEPNVIQENIHFRIRVPGSARTVRRGYCDREMRDHDEDQDVPLEVARPADGLYRPCWPTTVEVDAS
jgi:hypothetical protein